MKQTMGMSIAVMALLGQASSIDVEKHRHQQSLNNNKELMQVEEIDDEEGDQFMEESIREAEAEYKKN
tara:strand:+ start:92 stop:295 length:204 start_codon:yes stop_codon:yes gene_type:complete